MLTFISSLLIFQAFKGLAKKWIGFSQRRKEMKVLVISDPDLILVRDILSRIPPQSISP